MQEDEKTKIFKFDELYAEEKTDSNEGKMEIKRSSLDKLLHIPPLRHDIPKTSRTNTILDRADKYQKLVQTNQKLRLDLSGEIKTQLENRQDQIIKRYSKARINSESVVKDYLISLNKLLTPQHPLKSKIDAYLTYDDFKLFTKQDWQQVKLTMEKFEGSSVKLPKSLESIINSQKFPEEIKSPNDDCNYSAPNNPLFQ